MKIASPIREIDEVKPVIEAGADEIYCGILTKEERKRYTNIGCLNRRPSLSANFENFLELKGIVSLAHSYGVLVTFTINHFYSEIQYPSVLEQIKRAIDSGVDALAVQDIGLLSILKEKNPSNTRIHISTAGTTFNSETVNFYKELGASRIILPRQLSIKEIGEIAGKAVGMELEAFILNYRCRNIDGFCTFQHGVTEVKGGLLVRVGNTNMGRKFTNSLSDRMREFCQKYFFKNEYACCLNYDFSASDSMLDCQNFTKEISPWFNLKNFMKGCGSCSLYDLNKLGIYTVKIIGRGDPINKKVRDVGFIKGSIDLLEEDLTKREFTERVKELYQKTYLSACNPGYCYYPESEKG